VTGLDATPLFLRLAREDAERRGVDVEYVAGDMRELPWMERFDAVLCWFTSFGYFDDDGNRLVLRESAKALKPGGRLLVNLQNGAVVVREQHPAHVSERDGNFLVDTFEFDLATSRQNTERIVIRDGETRRTRYALRTFMPGELADWLRQAGFGDVELYDGQGGELTLTSWRMSVLARR
jgi:SAM-dependent methyltransferase